MVSSAACDMAPVQRKASNMELSRLIALARGDGLADLVLANAQVVNVYSGRIERTNVAIADGVIVGLGDGYQAKERRDLKGRFLSPGLMDAHVHVESAMVPPSAFASAVVPRGVTTVVTDPHEIGNVMGLFGIRFMLEDARRAPFTMFANASSCVPATALETSGARLEAQDLVQLLDDPHVLGLSEMMNYPGVVAGEPGVLAKLQAFAGRVIDGHCPGLSGSALNAYIAAGIMSDHECTTVEEAREKLERGLTLFIREGTAAHNLEALLPLITPVNEQRICWCTDDRTLSDLLSPGSIDHIVRTAIARGLDPVSALRIGTLNPATYWRLWERGAIAPGKRADLMVFSDLQCPRAEEVYVAGRRVAENGALRNADGEPKNARKQLPNTVRVDWAKTRLEIPAKGEKVRVIGAAGCQLVTADLLLKAKVSDGLAVADVSQDMLKMAVLERHEASGRTGLGFVRGIGLKQGAMAGTVAHDHHNLVVIGADDASMWTAAQAVAETGGGLAVAVGDRVLARLALPIAGLMSDQPIQTVDQQLRAVLSAAREQGSALYDPFMTMSFLALEVIPALKLTDRGLVDVNAMKIVPLFG